MGSKKKHKESAAAPDLIQVMTISLRPEALAHLRTGTNLVAVEVKLPSPIDRKLFDMGIYFVP